MSGSGYHFLYTRPGVQGMQNGFIPLCVRDDEAFRRLFGEWLAKHPGAQVKDDFIVYEGREQVPYPDLDAPPLSPAQRAQAEHEIWLPKSHARA